MNDLKNRNIIRLDAIGEKFDGYRVSLSRCGERFVIHVGDSRYGGKAGALAKARELRDELVRTFSEDGSVSVRVVSATNLVREAVRCLGRHADPESLETLVPLVCHPDWSVRSEAIEVLAPRKLGTPVTTSRGVPIPSIVAPIRRRK